MPLSTTTDVRATIAAHRGEVVLKLTLEGGVGFWLSPFSAAELEQWWAKKDSFMFNPDGVWDALFIACGDAPPPHRVFDVPGQFLHAECEADWSLWDSLSESQRHYKCLICCDEDSFLQRPDGTRILHRVYHERRIPE